MAIFRENFNFKIAVYSRASYFMALGMTLPGVAGAVEFNEDFLQKNGSPVELRYFEKGSSVLPGSYSVDIYLNQTMVKRQDINFSASPETGEVKPVIQVGLLRDLGSMFPA